jgi:GntR family transcriptional regulator
MELIDRENHQKLYIQLYEIIRKKIENNEWAVESQIPTEQELCKMFNVSRATVRTAILELTRQGFLKRQQGKGTFICKTAISGGLLMITSFRELLFDDNITFDTSVLAQTVMMPTDDLDLEIEIPLDKRIIYVKRLHTVNDKPVLLQESFIPHHICPLLLEEDLINSSLFEIFEKKCGIKITKIKTFFELASLKEDESRLLKLAEGSPSILLTQQIFSGNTQIMYTRSIKGSEKLSFSLDLERKAS